MTLFTPPNTVSTLDRDILSVTQLNRRAKQLLETHLPLLWVEGELSNVSVPSSGHWYFTLKDEYAQVRCAMFKGRNQLVKFIPKQGQQVLLRARVSLYEGRGDYQLIAEHLEEAGSGALQRAFEALKAKLSAEGLFDSARKKPLPTLPKHIGVITSPTGAAIRDILSVLERRFPAIPVTILPVAVQGKDAAPQIVNALNDANRAELFDVLIVGRGGGSLEDLWPFNEESVARAMAQSTIPIVSAVGHEVDFTIADFVADLRAPTPSAAAELIVPDGDQWLETFIGYEFQLEDSLRGKIAHWQQKTEWLQSRLRHPGERLQQQAQRLDGLEIRLARAIKHRLAENTHRLNHTQTALNAHSPERRILQLRARLQSAHQTLKMQTEYRLNNHKQRLASLARVLSSVSPLNTLERGYAIALDTEQQVIQSVSQAKLGEQIEIKLADGSLLSSVKQILPKATI